jgi:hypothetical protein
VKLANQQHLKTSNIPQTNPVKYKRGSNIEKTGTAIMHKDNNTAEQNREIDDGTDRTDKPANRTVTKRSRRPGKQ